MSGDWISDMLGKLSEKTGREWSLMDLIRLAQKMPELSENNVDALLSELSEMGLNLPEQKRDRLKQKVMREEGVTPDDLEELKKRFAEKEAKEEAKHPKATAKYSRRLPARRRRTRSRRRVFKSAEQRYTEKVARQLRQLRKKRRTR
ncbi:hypothetical protein LOK74_00145 [Brevibacillus humidisoli]|uniref:hypothetical protein n=1 Tax=Brevibacillus humidisoli TaxID=2895522 RepID=UPI001E478AC3|nr:hypothetical protein [Brevibacillus humidisoli]UFJ41013.1 hypothetical protein LOK74_00145 [Brevibacillus humidisoli]